VENDPKLADIVFRIQTVCRLLFSSTTIFKLFATAEHWMALRRTLANKSGVLPKGSQVHIAAAEIRHKCPQCGKEYKFYAKFKPDPDIDKIQTKKGLAPFPRDGKMKCSCGFESDLSSIRSQLEAETGMKVIS
jgi:hypothetical protein